MHRQWLFKELGVMLKIGEVGFNNNVTAVERMEILHGTTSKEALCVNSS